MTRFATPEWFAAASAIVVWIAWVVWNRRRGIASFEISAIELAGTRTGIRARTAWLPSTLAVLGFALVIVALARPQRIFTFSSERRGIDIVVALDASGSMAAEDFRPKNRFAVAKQLIAQFIDKRADDRIGIVTFGNRAATRVPVTFDHRIAQAVLDKSDVGDNGDGTAIGHAIATSVNRLKNSKAHSRIIILLTDGVNNSGSIEPMTAAGLAKQLGIRIYTIGVGSNGVVPVPIKVQNRMTGEVETIYRPMRADLDEDMLQAIAQQTGGAYFRATDTQTLQGVFARIDQLEKTSLEAPKVTSVDELYEKPLAVGLLLLAFAILAGESIWMRLPA